MWEILRDPVSLVAIGIVTVVVAIAVPVVVFVWGRRRKELSYEIVTRTPVASVAEGVDSRLQMVFDGAAVRDVQLVVIRIVNSGNVPITRDDYERPVRIVFRRPARLLTAEQLSSDPESLGGWGGFSYNAEGAKLHPMLFNGGDSITLQLLVAGLQGEMEIDGRVVGVRHIKEMKPRRDALTWRELLIPAGVGIGISSLGGILVEKYAAGGMSEWMMSGLALPTIVCPATAISGALLVWAMMRLRL